MEQQEKLYFDRYTAEKILGEGSYGKVKLARDVTTNEKRAMKKQVHITRIKREVRIMRLLSHPHIARLIDVSETDKEIILAMEFIQGGELFNYIVSQSKVKERFARRFFRQCLSAVDYCHQNCVIHRDLKPENLLLDQYQNIKIIDFGFVNMFDPTEKLNTFCGSPFYASPEMVTAQEYVGPEVDVWSLGVILFTMLSGHLPFQEENTAELCRRIASASYTTPDYFTESSADMISRMLSADPKSRITIEEIRNHVWTCEGYSGPPNSYVPERAPLTMDSNLDEEVLEKMSKYGFLAYAQKEKIIQPRSPAFCVYYLIKEHLERKKVDAEIPKPVEVAVPASVISIPSVNLITDTPISIQNLPLSVPTASHNARRPSIGIPNFARELSHIPLTETEIIPLQQAESAAKSSHSTVDGEILSLAQLPKSRKFSMFQGWIKTKDSDFSGSVHSGTFPRKTGRSAAANNHDRSNVLHNGSENSLGRQMGKARRPSGHPLTSQENRSSSNSSDGILKESPSGFNGPDMRKYTMLTVEGSSKEGSQDLFVQYEGPRPSYQSEMDNSIYNVEGHAMTKPGAQYKSVDNGLQGPRPSIQSLASAFNSADFDGRVGPRPSFQSLTSVDAGRNNGRPSINSRYESASANDSQSHASSSEMAASDNVWTPDDSKIIGRQGFKRSPLETVPSISVTRREPGAASDLSVLLDLTSSQSKVASLDSFKSPAVPRPGSSTIPNLSGSNASHQMPCEISSGKKHSTPASGFTEEVSTPKQKPKFFESLSLALKRFVSADAKKRASNGLIREIAETNLLDEKSTSKKPIADIIEEINRVLSANKIEIVWSGPFKGQCTHEHISFEIELCHIRNTEVHGVEFKRSKGSAWIYQSICREIIGQWNLQ